MAEHRPLFDLIAACGAHENFTLAGLAGPMPDGSRGDVYVHGKLMLVDDVFATIGSTNFAERSFRNQTEMNVSFQDSADGQGAALRPVRRTSRAGYVDARRRRGDAPVRRRPRAPMRKRREAGDMAWQGIAFALDPATYAS